MITALLALACAPPVPVAVRPTIDWLTAKGFSCTYAWPEHERSAQWTCHEPPSDIRRSVVVDGDGDGVDSMTAQVHAPEDELIMDRSAALGVLEELSLSAPLNAGIRDQAGTWLRSAPADATTT